MYSCFKKWAYELTFLGIPVFFAIFEALFASWVGIPSVFRSPWGADCYFYYDYCCYYFFVAVKFVFGFESLEGAAAETASLALLLMSTKLFFDYNLFKSCVE